MERVIFLLFQAILAAKALTWQRESRDRWLGRLLAVEGVFLALFGYWYTDRYTDWPLWSLSLPIIVMIIIVIAAAILLGGWVWEWRRARR